MAKNTKIGIPPRYSFILNPHEGTRLSKCPRCDKLTYPRKFAFLIFVEGWGPMALGKTCKYCSRCELIMMHQDELEAELSINFSRIAPEAIGNEYMVLGTIEKKVWQEGLKGERGEFGEMMKHAADFKQVYDLDYQPARWCPADEKE